MRSNRIEKQRDQFAASFVFPIGLWRSWNQLSYPVDDGRVLDVTAVKYGTESIEMKCKKMTKRKS